MVPARSSQLKKNMRRFQVTTSHRGQIETLHNLTMALYPIIIFLRTFQGKRLHRSLHTNLIILPTHKSRLLLLFLLSFSGHGYENRIYLTVMPFVQ